MIYPNLKTHDIKDGDIYASLRCGEYVILNKNKWDDISVRFIKTGTEKTVSCKEIKTGKIKDPYAPTVFAVGCFGDGVYSSKNHKVSYNTWKHMLSRCYCPANESQRRRYKERNVTVCEEWLNFQNFAKWFYSNYKEGFVMDKDLVNHSNLQYSPETCTFVPIAINQLLLTANNIRGEYPVGVSLSNRKTNPYTATCKIMNVCGKSKQKHIGNYKTVPEAFEAYRVVKKENIVKVANYYRNDISDDVYDFLISYNIVEYPE